MKHKTSVTKLGGAFIAGAAAAAAAGIYYLYGPKGKKHQKQVEGWVVQAKGEILEKLENTKELTQEKYEEIVDKAIQHYAQIKKVSKEKAENLAQELREHWKNIEKETKEKIDNKNIRRARRKIAKAIDPDN